MSEAAITQLGLLVAYSAVSVLMLLTHRVEPSRALRIWSLAFFFFAANEGFTALREELGLPEQFRAVSWSALTGAALCAVAGTVVFIGRPVPKRLFVLGAFGLAAMLIGLVLGLDQNVVRFVVFSCMGVAFVWAGLLTLRIGDAGDVGPWVCGSAMFFAGVYALSWPTLVHYSQFLRFEHFLDLSLVSWGAAGALLIHYERSRSRIRAMAANELELQARIERSERLDALGRLAGGVAHDFNNVLTTVIHGSELALRQLEEPAKAAAHIELVLEAARGATSFTRQLLALGRRRLPGRKPVRVAEAIRGAMCIIRPTLRSHHTLVFPPVDDSIVVLAGEGQIEQLVVNLSINAIDAMPNGGTLELCVRVRDARVSIVVSDSGCGMSEDTLTRVFEPFFSTKSGKGGSGLGLTTVYAIVRQLDGDIQVTSAPGTGSRFSIDLPLHHAPARSERTVQRTERLPSTVRVLVVDDQDTILHSLAAGLRGAGFQVVTANSAEAALRIVEQETPSLLLTDIQMPGFSGLELATKVHQIHAQLLVVFMTGCVEDDVDSGKYGGTWLVKPFTQEELVAAIRATLDRATP